MRRHAVIANVAAAILLVYSPAASSQTIDPLRFRDEIKDSFVGAPGIATDIRIDIEGTISRTIVTQYFLNDTESFQEGIYQFPLPETAAVDSLTMMIGDRRVIGFVAKKAEAREVYEDAKAKGQAAGLVDQYRPNLFKTSVANIPPRSLIAIEIEYQGEVSVDERLFSLRVPLAITPRYERLSSERLQQLVSAAGQDWADPLIDRLALADFAGGNNPVNLSVTLRPGFAIASVTSESHAIRTRESVDEVRAEGQHDITLVEGISSGEQDFTLAWTPRPGGGEFVEAVHVEQRDDGYYSHLLMVPPALEDTVQVVPEGGGQSRHVTYIIDVSGSMDGPSIAQAKQALSLALDDLDDDDVFNVIAFSDVHHKIFEKPTRAERAQIRIAKDAVEALRADGGTEMLPALIEALTEPTSTGHLRQIVFMTDGAVSNEDQIAAMIKKLVDDARFFAIGIGPAPNAHLMRQIATAGRGTFSYIDDINTVERELSTLFKKMTSPVLTDLEVVLPAGQEAEILPARLPDLLIGEPVSVVIRSKAPVSTLTIEGRRGGHPWRREIVIDQPRSAKGISKIFARRKIETLAFEGLTVQDPSLEKDITDIAIRHQLVSDHTSLVGVDEALLSPATEPLVQKRHDPTLPLGWQADRMKALEAEAAFRRLLEQKLNPEQNPQSLNQLLEPIDLPQTATGFQLFLVSGLALIFGALILVLQRRRYHA